MLCDGGTYCGCVSFVTTSQVPGGHFFIFSRKYESFLLSFYKATSVPLTLYALAQFPLYFDLLITIITRVPWPSNKADNF
ncbi:hypothetical protein S83_057795 [Arachis hypogaea]